MGWRVIATGRRPETLERVRKLGAVALKDNSKAVREADIIVISVKPQQLSEVANEIANEANGKLVISVAAAVPLSWLRKRFRGAVLVRAMPNINVLSGSSFTLLAVDYELDEKYRRLVETLFETLGFYMWVDEKYFGALTALGGSGPAFLAELIDALTLGGVAAGLPREIAYKVTLYTVYGTALTLIKNNIHPAELRDIVTTPAGTTIRGLMSIQGMGVKRALIDASIAYLKRGGIVRSTLLINMLRECVITVLTHMLSQKLRYVAYVIGLTIASKYSCLRSFITDIKHLIILGIQWLNTPSMYKTQLV